MATVTVTETEKKERLKKAKAALSSFAKTVEKKDRYIEVGLGKDMKDFGVIEMIPWGVYKIDEFTGGLPKGKFTVIGGPPSSGKTTLMLRTIGYLQKQGLIVAYANNERSYDKVWATKQGVNVDELIGGNFETLEDCLNFCIRMAEEAVIDVLVIDTINGIAAAGEQSKKSSGKQRDLDDDTMALIPRKLSQFFRQGTTKVDKSKMSVVLIAQIRMDLGAFVATEKITGGNALNHYKMLDIWVRRAAKKDSPDGLGITGYTMVLKIMKSKLPTAREGSTTRLAFFYDRGFDDKFDIVKDCIDKEIISNKQGNYSYTDKSKVEYKCKGKDNLESWELNNKVLKELKEKLNESRN